MNPMTKHRPLHSVAKAIVIMVCVAALLNLFGCANTIRTPEPLEEGQTDREFIVLRTGQTCEVKGSKIIACERNTFKYAESKADVEAMKAEEQNDL